MIFMRPFSHGKGVASRAQQWGAGLEESRYKGLILGKT
jgi:hypothetical protein